MHSYSDKAASYFAHARTDIAPLLPAQCSRVLELGCGAGATLGWLRQARRVTHCVGIEIAADAAERARAHADQVYCLNFEHQRLPEPQAPFDLVLCLDVLEHLMDPWAMVDRLVREHLAPGGTLVVSLPNVRHYSVVGPLVFQGRWDYADAGLLDRTHIRFFTRRSALALLQHPHLAPARYHANGFTGWRPKRVLNALTLGLLAEFVTYQHLLSATRQPGS
ncbi:MAG: hypothetical protein Fur007_10550 [Rhodoferax sp.]